MEIWELLGALLVGFILGAYERGRTLEIAVAVQKLERQQQALLRARERLRELLATFGRDAQSDPRFGLKGQPDREWLAAKDAQLARLREWWRGWVDETELAVYDDQLLARVHGVMGEGRARRRYPLLWEAQDSLALYSLKPDVVSASLANRHLELAMIALGYIEDFVKQAIRRMEPPSRRGGLASALMLWTRRAWRRLDTWLSSSR